MALDDSALAIVQWTHTLIMKPMLVAARQQIRRAPWAEHHVILSSCGDSVASCDNQLAAAAPLVENVTCVNASAIAHALPALDDLRSTFHGRKSNAPETIEIGLRRWCWNSCDGPYLFWYKSTGRSLTHVRFFWFLEWDVVWTGNIASILRTWNALRPDRDADVITPANRLAAHTVGSATARNASTSRIDTVQAAVPYDLLCADPAFASVKWPHRQKRDEELVPLNSTYHCVTEVYRITHRLLRHVIDFSSQRRGAMFCELRSASICAMHPWCRIRSFVDRIHMPLLFSHRMAAARVIRGGSRSEHVVTRTRKDWVNSWGNRVGILDQDLQNMSEPMLFHAFKWSPGNNSAVPPFGHRLASMINFDQGQQTPKLTPTMDLAKHWSWS